VSPSRLVPLVFVALCALLALPGGARAGSSTVQIREEFTTTTTFDTCGPVVAETVQTSTFINLQVSDTPDASGLPTLLHRTLRVQLDGTWSANGKTLRFAANVVVESPQIVANGPATVTLPDGSQRTGASYSVRGEGVNGVQLRVNLADGRLVFIDAGRVSYDVTFVLFADGLAPPFMTVAQGDFAASGPHPLDPLGERGRDCPTIRRYLG
jgi:hypothetical protein